MWCEGSGHTQCDCPVYPTHAAEARRANNLASKEEREAEFLRRAAENQRQAVQRRQEGLPPVAPVRWEDPAGPLEKEGEAPPGVGSGGAVSSMEGSAPPLPASAPSPARPLDEPARDLCCRRFSPPQCLWVGQGLRRPRWRRPRPLRRVSRGRRCPPPTGKIEGEAQAGVPGHEVPPLASEAEGEPQLGQPAPETPPPSGESVGEARPGQPELEVPPSADAPGGQPQPGSARLEVPLSAGVARGEAQPGGARPEEPSLAGPARGEDHPGAVVAVAAAEPSVGGAAAPETVRWSREDWSQLWAAEKDWSPTSGWSEAAMAAWHAGTWTSSWTPGLSEGGAGEEVPAAWDAGGQSQAQPIPVAVVEPPEGGPSCCREGADGAGGPGASCRSSSRGSADGPGGPGISASSCGQRARGRAGGQGRGCHAC